MYVYVCIYIYIYIYIYLDVTLYSTWEQHVRKLRNAI